MAERVSKLKKRSGPSYRSRLLEPLPLFLDRALGRRSVAQVLRAEENVKVYVHDDHFEPDVPDHVWIPKVVRRGWVILTKDKRIRRHPLERDALLRARAYAFFLTAGDLKGKDMGNAFVAALPKIRKLVARYHAPMIATVSRTGSVGVL